jgi:hypothetical protein
MTGQPQIVLGELWQRESQAGRTYYSGYLGANRLLLFDAGMQDHPTRPGEQVHIWRLVLQPKDDQAPRSRSDQSTRPPLPARGQRTWSRSRDAGRAQQAQTPFSDDTDAAIADLEGRGR